MRDFQAITVKLGSTITELETRLAEKADLEEALATWMAHHENMSHAKEDL